jgi:YesN/AraC family two-component response regulator
MFTILLVEDNRLFCQSFRACLLSRFPDVIITEAADSIDAMQKIDAQTFDLVFMDIKLPGVNGLYLSKMIKERYPELPIIILSAYDLAEYREAALGLGAEEYIVKTAMNSRHIEELVRYRLTGKTTAACKAPTTEKSFNRIN